MYLNNLTPARGSVRNRKRIGRGQGSGHGGTSTKGHKGDKSHTGFKKRRGFEGGQQPLQRRIPRYGFKNPTRVEYKAVNLDVIEAMAEKNNIETVDLQTLIDHGFTSKNVLVKVLARGELKKNLHITAHAFSQSAKEAIEKAGGKYEVVGRISNVRIPNLPSGQAGPEQLVKQEPVMEIVEAEAETATVPEKKVGKPEKKNKKPTLKKNIATGKTSKKKKTMPSAK